MSTTSRAVLSVEDERALVAQAMAGDAQALNTLIEAHYPAMYHLALKYTRDPERAQDATQESCVQVLRHLSQFRAESRFSSWMARIVINSARLRYRGERRLVPVGDGSTIERASPDPEPEQRVADKQVLDLVDRFLQDTRDGDYQLFVRRFIDGESVKKISRETGISVPAIKTRVHRARLRLRTQCDDAQWGVMLTAT